RSLKIASCGPGMTAAAKIYCDLAHIDLSVGPHGYFEHLRSYLIKENGYFYSFCQAQLAYDPFQVLSVYAVKDHVFSAQIAYNAFSVLEHDAFRQDSSHNLILYIRLFVEGFVYNPAEIKSGLH